MAEESSYASAYLLKLSRDEALVLESLLNQWGTDGCKELKTVSDGQKHALLALQAELSPKLSPSPEDYTGAVAKSEKALVEYYDPIDQGD